jgi:hypothetical protein
MVFLNCREGFLSREELNTEGKRPEPRAALAGTQAPELLADCLRPFQACMAVHFLTLSSLSVCSMLTSKNPTCQITQYLLLESPFHRQSYGNLEDRN